jgi:hypothetical protein
LTCKHPAALLKGTRDGIICACGAIFATWAELEETRKKEEPAKPESKSVKRRKKATE